MPATADCLRLPQAYAAGRQRSEFDPLYHKPWLGSWQGPWCFAARADRGCMARILTSDAPHRPCTGASGGLRLRILPVGAAPIGARCRPLGRPDAVGLDWHSCILTALERPFRPAPRAIAFVLVGVSSGPSYTKFARLVPICIYLYIQTVMVVFW